MQRQPDDGAFLLSNPSSRLVTGNSSDYARLESALSELFGGRSALVADRAIWSTRRPAGSDGQGRPDSGHKLVHAELIDGLRLGEAEWRRFGHNDTEHLERLLARRRDAYRNVWIVT